jgi:hypothetical protein
MMGPVKKEVLVIGKVSAYLSKTTTTKPQQRTHT